MKIEYRPIHLSKANLNRLDQINEIIESYQAQGYVLTLRQLYYQLVSSDVIPNTPAEYNKLGVLLKEGRMSGVVDWEAIEDRLRKPDKPGAWDSPAEIVETCIRAYRVDRMKDQDQYIEVWVEKDALSGVLKRVTEEYGIPIMVNRGYSSATAMHDAHNRFNSALDEEGQDIKIIYIGDFDPSGQDMIRDIENRIQEFNNHIYSFQIIPIALTWEQIQEYNPPPNPAKVTDPRAADYIRKYGPISWEVDALRPEVLNQILTDEIERRIDPSKFSAMMEIERNDKTKLRTLKSKL